MKQKKNFQKISFTALLRIFFLLILVTIVMQAYSFVSKRRVISLEKELKTQEKILEEQKNSEGYPELLSLKAIQDQRPKLQWSSHIQQVLDIFHDLQNVDNSESQTIILSDFQISLDEISVNGAVSTLKALYYNSPTGKFKALLDRFQELEFIRHMYIKEYNKTSNIYYEFVLHAKVLSND